MRVVVNRVNQAQVTVDKKVIGKIDQGLLVYLGISQTDNLKIADKMVQKLINLRIFSDAAMKMNLNIKDVKGSFLVVSQFTLYGDTKSNNRPSFTQAAKPEEALVIYQYIVNKLKEQFVCETGEFGAHMQVESINCGPVNILIEID